MNPSKLDFHVVVEVVVKVQAAVRRFLVRKRFQEKLRLLSWIQTNYRNRKDTALHCSFVRISSLPSTFEGLSVTVVLIQSMWRGQLGRRRSKLMFESTPQPAFRLFSALSGLRRRRVDPRILTRWQGRGGNNLVLVRPGRRHPRHGRLEQRRNTHCRCSSWQPLAASR